MVNTKQSLNNLAGTSPGKKKQCQSFSLVQSCKWFPLILHTDANAGKFIINLGIDKIEGKHAARPSTCPQTLQKRTQTSPKATAAQEDHMSDNHPSNLDCISKIRLYCTVLKKKKSCKALKGTLNSWSPLYNVLI